MFAPTSAALVTRRARSLRYLFVLLLGAVCLSAASAEAQNMAFTVAPGSTIKIQNLTNTPWYFYDDPTPAAAQMFRVNEGLTQSWGWGEPQFRRDLNGNVSKVNPREFLLVSPEALPAGSVISIPYYDVAFESRFTITINVQSANAQVLSMNRLDASPTSSSTLRWQIVFDRAVAGVRAANLALTYTANGLPNPTITSVIPNGAPHTHWTVTASVLGRETGTVGLKWNASDIESPAVPTLYTGQSYELTPAVPTTFSVRTFGTINIRNVTDDAWYFTAPPATSTASMFRVSEDGLVIDAWGSAQFGPDTTGSGRNAIRRNQSLRIYSGETPIGSVITVNHFVAQNVARSIPIAVTNLTAQVLAITRLDASPVTTSAGGPTNVRWQITFDRPVAGVTQWSLGFNNYAGVGASLASIVPDPTSGFRKWTVTTALAGDGNGAVALHWNPFGQFASESPHVANSFTGETYDLNPLSFSVAPGGTIDIENTYAERLYFRANVAPLSAQMFRVGQDTIGVIPWGSAGFSTLGGLNSANWISRQEWLRISAGTTPVGTPIVVRSYRTVFPGDPGFEIRVHVQVPDAQVTSLNILDPSPTVANSVRWEATFDKVMTNVTAANFGFINTGQLTPTPTITSVVPVATSNNTRWIITANTTGTGTGLLGLRYLGHRVESPSAPNTFTGQSYQFSNYPLITSEPTPLSAIIVTGGQAPTLSITATIRTGETLHYQWRIGVPADPYLGVNDPKNIPGATSSSFTPPTNVAGHHPYYCRVFTINPNTGQPSGYYATSLPSTMHVYDPPEIVTQPANIAIPSHGRGTLTVGATGTDLHYQWFKGNTGDRTQPMSGSNAASFLTPALTENTRFWVLVSNPLGAAYEVESSAATARVIRQVVLEQNRFTPVILSTLTNMKARALDSEGVATPGATLTFKADSLGHVGGALAGGNFGGSLFGGGSATETAITNADGWATAPGMWTNTRAGTYQVLAISQGPGDHAVSAAMTIENQPGPAHGFIWVTQPSASATAGVPSANQPVLILRDAWSNAVKGTAQVTATADRALGLLQGTTTVTAVDGAVAFTNLSHHTAEKFKLRTSPLPARRRTRRRSRSDMAPLLTSRRSPALRRWRGLGSNSAAHSWRD